jgi:hypothetical protein
MKTKQAKTKKGKPRGVVIKMKRGKIVWPKQSKEPSAEVIRRDEAKELIAALVDAAHDIGTNGIVDDYSKNDFHLYPTHITGLLRPDHPSHAFYSSKDKQSRNRVAVPWPWRQGMDATTTNELRERPFEIIGLLMRKVLDGDSTFFDAVAETLREAKKDAKIKVPKANSRGKNHVGRIVADMPSLGMIGDPDWFTRIVEPLRKNKAPKEIWKLCKQRYNNQQPPPTRREIRDHLSMNGISCSNLRTVLSRMHLDYLQEGGRSRKT